MSDTPKNIPVLIVGAGPVGLSMALCLARQNIPSLVVEKHSGRTPHPRARGVSMRTMELFRQWGNINVYETTTTGAVLIRPDGHVAWRSKEIVTRPIERLIEVFSILIKNR